METILGVWHCCSTASACLSQSSELRRSCANPPALSPRRRTEMASWPAHGSGSPLCPRHPQECCATPGTPASKAGAHLPCARTPCHVRPPRRGSRFPADSVVPLRFVRSSSPSASHRGVIPGVAVGSRSRAPAVPRAKGFGRAHDGCAGGGWWRGRGGVAAWSRQKAANCPPTRRAGHAAWRRRTAPHRTAPHRTAPHRTAPHRTAPHRTAPHPAEHQHGAARAVCSPVTRL